MSIQFKYKAYDSGGNLVQGVMSAETNAAATLELKKQGLIPLSLTAQRTTSSNSKVSSHHIEEITSELALLLKSGLQINTALEVLVGIAPNQGCHRLISDLLDRVNHGGELWKAMSEHPKVFDTLYVQMVKIGESSGRLPQIFEKLASNLLFQRELSKKVTQAMIYPAFIFGVCLISVVAIFNFVVPSMSSLFESLTEIPSYTQFLISASEWMQNYQLFLFAGVVFGIVAVAKYHKEPWFKSRLDLFLMAAPLTKTAMLLVERIRYSSAMHLMLSSGVPLVDAMKMASLTVNSPSVSSQLVTAHNEVSQGRSIMDALVGIPIFDSISSSLLKVGEETGQLDLIFGEISERARSTFEDWMLKMTAMLEPLMIVFMGGLVGSVVVIMLLSVVSINDISF